ncbi:hypothetical protein XENORESO_012843 [Xenotaenia resolanae]|uniref:Uncharacterized protein n=1 Tax=Xenotaenia resolanae TaxID=208358 RepID=A0ABV0VYZ0_9TELE
MFDHNALLHVWIKPNSAYWQQHLPPTVKHSSGGWIIWGYLAATITDSTMTFIIPKYPMVKCKTICPTADIWPKLGHQQYHNPMMSFCSPLNKFRTLQTS